MGRLLALPEVAADMMRVPGGSAANVMKGLACLAQGSSAATALAAAAARSAAGNGAAAAGSSPPGAALDVAFVGMVGSDAVGAEYRASIAAHGVRPLLLQSSSGAPTATCLCLVTPDGQRTMRTCLSAALELNSPSLLPAQLGGSGSSSDANGSSANGSSAAAANGTCSSGSTGGGSAGGMALLHCEGYCLYRLPVAAAAMRAAHAAGARVSLDLASFEVVQSCWAALDSLLQERLVDIVFCNEQEAEALCQAAALPLPAGCTGEQQVAAAQDFLLGQRGVTTVIVSCGSKGCIARSADGQAAATAAAKVPVVDTIGAGDFFTSGCLYGLLSGASLKACTECGCTAGTAAVQTAGAELDAEALQQLRSAISDILAADQGVVTLGLCQYGTPTSDLFVSLDAVDSSGNPSDLGTNDLHRIRLTFSDDQLAGCCSTDKGTYFEFDLPSQLMPGSQYALTVGSVEASATQIE
ncbi:sugar kinase [Chlorella sorokiniana]|uniref:Sugar kinase n=1 Tax=Chlorella sorokiniana TaxID=3076 RepID=A0A2P6TLV4_CHLSO|nr:sugar kinase [Chlorella sorokiniana]|eukprot:PRW45269.1 sugar kinase [Chlorella sorokiniana]